MVKKREEITAADVLEKYHYNPDTGVFTHTTGKKDGTVAGSLGSCNYLTLNVCGHNLLAQRVAWFLVNGEWSEHPIRHLDKNRHNNSIANLKPVSNKSKMSRHYKGSWKKRNLPEKDMPHSIDQIRELLRYDPETGDLWWKVPRKGVQMSKPAGTTVHVIETRFHADMPIIRSPVYRKVVIDRFEYCSHTLAWAITHGVWPEEIKHLDGDGCNNRLSNLKAYDGIGLIAREPQIAGYAAKREKKKQAMDDGWEEEDEDSWDGSSY